MPILKTLATHLRIGQTGEAAAARYLRKKGYVILERNYRAGRLETDIIACDGEYLVFAEVKTRTRLPEDTAYRTPAAAVDTQKKQCLLSCARAYLRTHPNDSFLIRMDVLEVYRDPKTHKILHIEHIQNAFGY